MTTRTPSQCMACARFVKESLTCQAFPQGIPPRISLGGDDHRQRAKGDHGLRFQQAEGTAAQRAFAQWRRVFG